MGQAVSLPVERREVAIGSPNIKPPAGWSNDEKNSSTQSPQCPMCRTLLREVVAPQTIYVSNTRRTSKVVGKTPARKRHTGKVLHPPDRFYFPEEPSSKPQYSEPHPSHHPVRSTRWKIYKRRLTAKCLKAKKQLEVMGNCCMPDQVMDHVQDHQTLGASSPVYNKNVKRVHQQVLNDSLSETGDELDPVFGEASFEASTSSHAKMAAFRDFPSVRQHNMDKSMEPYLQFLGGATVPLPHHRHKIPSDDSTTVDSIRRNNTDDSVLLEKSNSGTSSSDGSLESDGVLQARNKMESVARLKTVYREEKRTEGAARAMVHPVEKYSGKASSNPIMKTNSIAESTRYSYDADSSSIHDLSRNGRKSEVSGMTQLTQSTLLADPSALLKHLQEVGDTVNSPVAALFGSDDDDNYRPRVSSGLYSDMNSLVESHASEQERLPAGLFSDTGSEIEPEELTFLQTTARASMESQRSEKTLETAYNNQNTAARVSDFTASSSTDNQPKKSLDSQGSRRTVIHAINLPLNVRPTGKKNSLDSQKSANTIITAEPLIFPGRAANGESRIAIGILRDDGRDSRTSDASNEDKPVSKQSNHTQDGPNAQVPTSEAIVEFTGKSHSLAVPAGRDRTLFQKSGDSMHIHCENTRNDATSEPLVEQTKPRPSLKTSRRSSMAGRESLQLPALLQIAGWKNFGQTSGKGSQKGELQDHVVTSQPKSLETNHDDDEENEKPLKIKRQSDPLPLLKTKGTTAADMLRQSYPFFAHLREAESSEPRHATKSGPTQGAGAHATGSFAASVSQPSPSLSVESIPMLSSQVLGNAALLFSPSYLNGTDLARQQASRPQAADNGAVSINTLGSRGRTLPVISRDPVAIPARPVRVESDVASKQSEKRVRFSDIMNVDPGQEAQPSSVEIPPIRHKLSDLSDTTGLEPYRPSISSIRESIAPIPEEPANSAFSRQARWTYTRDSDLGNGVTPLRSGRTSTQPTASPLLRFQEAKTKFSGVASRSATEASYVGETRQMPGMRIKGSIVSARIAEMEEKSSKTQSTQPYPSKIEATKTDNNYLFEEEDETGKPIKSASSIWRQPPGQFGGGTERSPTLINGDFIGSHDKFEAKSEATKQSTIRHSKKHDAHPSFEVMSDYGGTLDASLNPLTDNYSVVSSGGESLRDLFKTHKANIEASNDSESLSDDDVDDFENMLNYQQDLSEGSSVDDETVSTIRQDRSKRFGSQYASYRMSVGGASVASSATGDTVSTIKQNRFSIVSSNSSKLMKWEQPSLPFRKNAPVRPTEQAVHSAPGVLSVSPVQKSPAQARTWRDLAAAAQERNANQKGGRPNHVIRSNLGERSINVVR